MSLKDRLSSQPKTSINIKKINDEPKYYKTSEISQGIDSLGEIDALFVDDEINSINIMGAKNIYIERKGKRSKVSLTYKDNIRLENIIKKNAQMRGLELDENHPYIEFGHKPGINVWASIPPLSSSAVMVVKCYKDKFADLKTLMRNQSFSKEIALFLEALASLKLNIVIAGKKNTLKTSLLSAIAKEVANNENGVILDYSNELQIKNDNIVTYDFKNYNNQNLIENIMSSNPSKVFLNDCRDLTIFEKYIEAGYRGICATYRANNPLDVLSDLYLKKGDVVIFVEQRDSLRFISSISLVNGSELENIFYINENLEHNSSGIVPEFCNDNDNSTPSINNAIFEADYKHTYYKSIDDDALKNALKKNINPEILKKFKKDLTLKEESGSTNQQEDEENL